MQVVRDALGLRLAGREQGERRRVTELPHMNGVVPRGDAT